MLVNSVKVLLVLISCALVLLLLESVVDWVVTGKEDDDGSFVVGENKSGMKGELLLLVVDKSLDSSVLATGGDKEVWVNKSVTKETVVVEVASFDAEPSEVPDCGVNVDPTVLDAIS